MVFFAPGTSSALGNDLISRAVDLGAAGAFDPNLNGQKLTFSIIDEEIVATNKQDIATQTKNYEL